MSIPFHSLSPPEAMVLSNCMPKYFDLTEGCRSNSVTGLGFGLGLGSFL